MSQISGIFYDGRSDAAHPAKISLQDGFIYFARDDGKAVLLDIKNIKFESPIGNITRNITWKIEGVEASFQTDDIEQYDILYAQIHGKNTASIIHLIEKNIYVVIGSLVVSVFIIYLYITQGVPTMSRFIAQQIPISVYSYTSDKSMVLFDEILFDPSKLASSDKHRITKKFNEMADKLNWQSKFDLKFRAMGDKGDLPNAFALPSGIIVITDGLVKIAKNDAQILAVLAHEIGHVTNRHGITAMVQASVLTLSATFITGELSGVSDLLVSNSIILTELSYSREFEKEADIYGVALIKDQGIGDAYLLIDILENMSEFYDDGGDNIDDDETGTDYFSSHPLTSERKKYLLDDAL
ncbi:MAG: M48 family metallopeptidase [Rhizobiales bacterium]|nr:M48 family metallopeptidase [Hyphomicrobiales bacterium]